jgi:hypothetical protein
MSLSEAAESLPDQPSESKPEQEITSQSASPESTPHQESSTPEVIQNEVWYYDDNTPGSNERPEWLQKKYKSVAEQAKAYNEAQKKLGAFKGAPDAYDIKLQDSDIQFNEKDPVIEDFLADAKENNVSQEYVSKLLKTYAKALKMQRPDLKRELADLGPNAKQDVTVLNNWAANHLSSEEMQDFRSLMTTAKSVRILQKLKNLSTKASTGPTPTYEPMPSKAAILKKVHDPRYAQDEQFREQVREELAKIV